VSFVRKLQSGERAVGRNMTTSGLDPARTALLDDHPLLRAGLRSVLDHDPKLHVVIDTGSPREALDHARTERIDIAIVDLVLPEMSGVDFTTELRRLQPSCCVLGLSVFDEPSRVVGIIRAGASGFANKTQPPTEILEAVHRVLGGVRYLPPSMSAAEIDRLAEDRDAWPLARLTTREREVFAMLARGCTNEEIAAQLVIAKRTVEAHRYNVMHKLAARGVVDLVHIALLCGVVVM
jgi:DNA-binding NarL/FixJ family response regulator